ncbi:lysine-specific permease [Chromobacterium alkanivorans]|uniref:amino acid permease n=1 Tax=Chromobacterium TaxID=535 RepID=UPI000653BBFF|nr:MULTISPECIES: amino acid permease [Chromobacterium]KMN83871.1 gamma-aminobutyrate permease [Chromobacterium sp. LK11]MBN3004100.1 amino acid permease [Chromobacterium alkanivorans]MCS3806563.1 lysine-specific permease [Chromobacterium alkanivorans]MCS3820901.1 lysine-specific permease [Chromobacterium alkanivorans]MCS3875823.1 lysine-specific permease [Chromobacterium alkanivorans]
MEKKQESQELRRTLQARHLSMIAIGGSIGTGLFLASGATVASAGAGGALIAYALIGLMVYFLMTSLGEMAAFMPESGSFQVYGSRFVDPAFGFAQGWNYWYNWAITVAVELAAAAIIMHYWYPAVPGIVWSAGFLLIIFVLNYFSVKGFGEAEFWCSMLKVATIVAFIVIGFLMIFGIMTDPNPQRIAPGLSVMQQGQGPFVGGLAAFVGVAMIVGFSFQGTELIGVAAGESANPGKTIPRAVRQIFWRILMFYMLSILIIGLILPYNDPLLLKNDMKDVGASPFTLVFNRAGFAMAASLMNAVILSAILSAGNSGMYASTRMLYTMARNKMAPKRFAELSSNGVPRNALYATSVIAALCFLTSLFETNAVYLWLLNSSGMTGFIAWLGVAISHYRFRRGYVKQGHDLADLPYQAKWFPLGPLFAFALCLLIMLGQNYEAFIGGHIDWSAVIATYLGIPLFLALWLGYKFKHKTRMVALEEIDFSEALVKARALRQENQGSKLAAATR